MSFDVQDDTATGPILANLEWSDWHADHLADSRDEVDLLDVEGANVVLDILGLLTIEQLATLDRSMDDVRDAIRSLMRLGARAEWSGVAELIASARMETATETRQAIIAELEWAAERATVCGLTLPDPVEIARQLDVEQLAVDLGSDDYR